VIAGDNAGGIVRGKSVFAGGIAGDTAGATLCLPRTWLRAVSRARPQAQPRAMREHTMREGVSL